MRTPSNYRDNYNGDSYKRRRKKKRPLRNLLLIACAFVCLILIVWDQLRIQRGNTWESPVPADILPENAPVEIRDDIPDDIAEKLSELLEHNEETYEFVTEFPNREKYLNQTIDLASDQSVKKALDAGEVPLLMQWDLRWGYAPYGDNIVGLAGCGPTCLSMAYIYLTGDVSLHPAAMAAFAYEQGFFTEYGTDWALWTDGAALLGIRGEVLSLDQSVMKNALQDGLIICSMRPGDFTTEGHFILIRGYDENGFYVNDPNRHSTSEQQWTYEKLWPQVKNLWKLSNFRT